MKDVKVQMVQMIEYTGTIESYNELVKNLGDDSHYPYSFIDDKGESTWKFTGNVLSFKTRTLYKPGDVYYIKVEDNHRDDQ